MSLQELGWILLLDQTAWDFSGCIPDESLPGKLLHAFTGYMAAPTILQLVRYVLYIAMMLHLLWKGTRTLAS
ncbi:hypothetical protein skT53_33220 [Effusibacillus dendaii]|uniref:Uncharacterized protein n=1 Tax=Effusibacillus dendaii TaxID=2743772 RepID=A0A7I8DE77_9BACL|nr:hypothetical protein skT53_33220 [Effusibacillus dendaii]